MTNKLKDNTCIGLVQGIRTSSLPLFLIKLIIKIIHNGFSFLFSSYFLKPPSSTDVILLFFLKN